MTNTLCDIETPSVLVAGFLVRLEAGGVNAEGRVVSVGLRIRVVLISGADGLRQLAEDTPVSLQFGGQGTLHVGDSEIVRWEDADTVVLSQPPAYSVWQRLLHPRFRIQVPMTALIGGPGGLLVDGETIDLSASGMACVLDDIVLAADAALQVTLRLPDGDFTARAVVLAGGAVHRLRFVDLAKEDLTRLVHLCRPDQMWARTIVM